MKQTIPIFFASNDKYVPYLDVAILSLVEHTTKEHNYIITILKTDISEENQIKLKKHERDNVSIVFYDVKNMLEPIKNTLPDMFYYTLAAYFRLFIEKAFPQYDKAIYLDCDVVLLSDIAELYNTDIGDNLVGAIYEQNTDRSDDFRNYVEDNIGIPYYTYFNSGVMVMNLKEFRKFKVQDRFLNMLTTYNFDCLAPDQEYINVICHGRVKYLPTGWNKHSFPEPPEGELKLCHYALSNKPWHYDDVINGEYFWKYAKKSEFYNQILSEFKHYSDADKLKDYENFQNILAGIERMKKSDRTFKKLWFNKIRKAS
ncbi:MAG: glycosyltransferase family 8 protein [Clostridia bacterium]|nr:glycosyltransferase family 8 protein [Clostridia bacterium]